MTRYGGLAPLPVLPPPGERRALRLDMGWTITAAADMLNVTRGTYRRWEKGEVTPNPHHQRDYCDLLSAFRDAINGGDREKPGGT